GSSLSSRSAVSTTRHLRASAAYSCGRARNDLVYSPFTMPPNDVAPSRTSWTILATIAGFAIVTVYCTYLTVYMTDVATGAIVEAESLNHYTERLARTSGFSIH